MVRRVKFGTARLKWIIQICSRNPNNFFFFSTFEAAPAKLSSSGNFSFKTDNGNTAFV
jgi:hypothetical protein